MDRMVICFEFPEPQEDGEMAAMIQTCRAFFEGRDDLQKVYAARGDAAETILFFVANGELPVEVPISDIPPDNEVVAELDRNARAYGFEIGRGHPLTSHLESVSNDNPFMKRDWKDRIDQEAEVSPLVRHAERELELIGQTAEDPEFSASIVNAVRAFASFGHSGGSASVAIPWLNSLLHFENLAPLTNDPEEWNLVGEDGDEKVWQCQRNPRAFSNDEGKTHYILQDDGTRSTLHISQEKT